MRVDRECSAAPNAHVVYGSIGTTGPIFGGPGTLLALGGSGAVGPGIAGASSFGPCMAGAGTNSGMGSAGVVTGTPIVTGTQVGPPPRVSRISQPPPSAR